MTPKKRLFMNDCSRMAPLDRRRNNRMFSAPQARLYVAGSGVGC